MKRITRFSLALIMFSLFSISYIVTSVSAQNGIKCGKASFDWCTNAEIAAGHGTAGMAPGYAPGTAPQYNPGTAGGAPGSALGNYGCGNPDKQTHVNCLRGLLSSTPYGLTVQESSPSKDGLGNYGCGNSNKSKHTNCLRRHLDQHGAHLQTNGAGPMNPPATFDDGLMGSPAMGAPGMAGQPAPGYLNNSAGGAPTGCIGAQCTNPNYNPGRAEGNHETRAAGGMAQQLESEDSEKGEAYWACVRGNPETASTSCHELAFALCGNHGGC
jgi:hypothetical protein